MAEFLDLMLLPFLACVILTGIHAYLGLHVIEREVIFVDLALAQVAALGATFGYLWNFPLHSWQSYCFSLGFSIAGAGVFALTRLRKQVVPQEALIGVVYAVAAAGAIIVLSRAPEGGEELKALFVGHLLFVQWSEIGKIAVLYSAIGIAHWFARKKFLRISQDPEGAFADGMKVRRWDFLFYATFAVVVTSSVELAGVLLVFSFLVVPSICGVLLSSSITTRIWLGWGFGLVTSVVGVWISYLLDIPTGAAVVCTFGACLLLVGASIPVRRLYNTAADSK